MAIQRARRILETPASPAKRPANDDLRIVPHSQNETSEQEQKA